MSTTSPRLRAAKPLTAVNGFSARPSRLHSHRGALEPHPVTDRHVEDPRASWPHCTEVRKHRRGHRPGRRERARDFATRREGGEQ